MLRVPGAIAWPCCLALWLAGPGSLALVAQAPAPPERTDAVDLSTEQRTRFLEGAVVLRTREASKGVTRTLRATLSDGNTTHDASIQTIDEAHAIWQSQRITELRFRDTWRFNLAAYHLSLLLGLDMVPVTVEREHRGRNASFTWWVDEVLADEGERRKKKLVAPDATRWTHQLRTQRIFDQLIANVDRNAGNSLIDSGWALWMIDHTRAFRLHTKLRPNHGLTRCERGLLRAMKELNAAELERATGRWLTRDEIAPLLARRDAIVEFFESRNAVY